MKKKIISLTFLLAILFSTCMVALAEEGSGQSVTTASQLKSHGAIVYQNGTDSVVIDSNDLYTLADAFDTFKAAVYSQMTEMNTYLTTDDEGINLTTSEDIYVVHSTPSDIVDPLSINFDTLIEGLAASQSIPHTPSEYGYAEGTNLYKTASGLLTTEASDETEMIEIEGATADSLSAGAAAWVNGELILGNGNDVEKAYNQGVEEVNLILSGLYLNLSVGEAGYGGNTSAQIPVGNLNSVTFTATKGSYGQLSIILVDNNGNSTNLSQTKYTEFYQRQTVNKRITIPLNKDYNYIQFSGKPWGGSKSTITISNFSIG